MNGAATTPLTDDDVARIAASDQFVALRRRRAAFLIPATIFAIVSFLFLPCSILIAPHAMATPLIGPMSAAFLFGLGLILISWLLLAYSVRISASLDVEAAELVRTARKQLR